MPGGRYGGMGKSQRVHDDSGIDGAQQSRLDVRPHIQDLDRPVGLANQFLHGLQEAGVAGSVVVDVGPAFVVQTP